MIGEKLRLFRIRRRLTQKQLAEGLYMDVKSISSYENNKNTPPLPVIKELCSFLKIELIIRENNIYLNDIEREDFNMIAQEEKIIIEGIQFDSDGKAMNLDKATDIFQRIKNTKLKDLPKTCNFTIPLDNNQYIEKFVLDKWIIEDECLITTIVSQKFPLPIGLEEKFIESKITDMPIYDSSSGIIDLYFKDSNLIIVYECRHQYNDNVIISDVYKDIYKIAEGVNIDIKERLKNIIEA